MFGIFLYLAWWVQMLWQPMTAFSVSDLLIRLVQILFTQSQTFKYEWDQGGRQRHLEIWTFLGTNTWLYFRPLNMREIKEEAKDIIYMDEINHECTLACPPGYSIYFPNNVPPHYFTPACSRRSHPIISPPTSEQPYPIISISMSFSWYPYIWIHSLLRVSNGLVL